MMLFLIASKVFLYLPITPTPITAASAGASSAAGGSDTAIIVAAIAAIALILSTIVTQIVGVVQAGKLRHHQIEREKAADLRAVRTEKRQRFYDASLILLNAALEYKTAAHQYGVIFAGETKETRNQRLNASLKNALSRVDEALLTTSVDDVGEQIEVIFRDLRSAFNRYINSLDTNAEFHGEFSHEHIEGALSTVDAKVEELREIIKTRLKGLEEPV